MQFTIKWKRKPKEVVAPKERAYPWIQDDEVDREFHILPLPPVPAEAWEFINEQKEYRVKGKDG